MRIRSILLSPYFLCCALLYGQATQDQAPHVQSPVVLPDGRVTFNLVAPNAATVKMTGTYPISNGYQPNLTQVPLTKDDKGVWTVTLGPFKPDVYNYAYIVDGVRALDPLNVHMSHNSSWVMVPGPGSDNYNINNVPHGQIHEVWFPSPTLNMMRRMEIYTPPGYEDSTARYPVLYLLHGGGADELSWLGAGREPEILDNLIAKGKAVPMIVVMPAGDDKHPLAPVDATVPPVPLDPSRPFGPVTRESRYFPKSIAPEIVPYVDKHYRTKADRDDRAIAGLSMGGEATLLAGLNNLDTFSWMGMFSSAAPDEAHIDIPLPADASSRRGPELGHSIDPAKYEAVFPMMNQDLNKKMHLFYWSIGNSDGLLEINMAVKKVMDEKGVKYVWSEVPGYGHEYGIWRQALQDFSSRLFKPASAGM